MSECGTMTVLTRPGFDRDVPTVVDSDALSGPGRVSNDIGSRRGFFMGSKKDHFGTLEQRFWAKVDKEASPDGCWLWTGGKFPNGYGRIDADRPNTRVHRLSFEWAKGPIPPGLTIDHLCRVRNCVNPAHLEAVSVRENTLRGAGRAAINAAKTHCPAGHEYTPENTRTIGVRSRQCRVCKRIRERRQYALSKDNRS